MADNVAVSISAPDFHAHLECVVDLGPRQKGAHMSRFEEVVNDAIGEVVLGEAAFRAETLAQRIAELVDGETSMGRSSGSTIVLKSDDYASGRHAQLTRHGGLLYVEDLGSTNGTFVNGRKTVGATPLRNGDTVRIGSTVFRYEE